MILIENKKFKGLVKAINSNLMRAQMEEKGDINLRNTYLESAGFDSVKLAKLLLNAGEKFESSSYLLSAGYSFEESGAIMQARACFKKVLNVGLDRFVEETKEGLERLKNLEKTIDNIDLNSKEGGLFALDHLIWKHGGLDTIKAAEYLEELGCGRSTVTVRNYARELEERKRVVIWGGPQGKIYHLYPNVAELATREEHYGKETMISGSIESRVTDSFNIDFQKWDYNKEIFEINSTILPKMLITIDIEGYNKNLDRFIKQQRYPLKAIGILEDFPTLEANGYTTNQIEYHKDDVFDSNVLISITGDMLYNRDS